MIRTADDLVKSILADSRVSGPEQPTIRNADDLVEVVLDEFAETRAAPLSQSEASDGPSEIGRAKPKARSF